MVPIVMTTTYLVQQINGVRSIVRKKAATALQLAGVFAALAGCGGGGSSTPLTAPSPRPTATPLPPAATAPTPGAEATPRGTVADSVAANFLPNYIPVGSVRYLHWATNKGIRVFIHPGINNVVDKTSSASMEMTRARVAVQEALGLWNSASSAEFQFTLVDSEENADIEIYFVDELRRLDGSFAEGVGIANYSFTYPNSSDTTRGELQNAVVQIRATQPAENMTDTIAHEIGHALGIEVHSTDPADLLFEKSLPPSHITQRDQNTLYFLYYSETAVGGRSVPSSSKKKSSIQNGEIVCDAS